MGANSADDNAAQAKPMPQAAPAKSLRDFVLANASLLAAIGGLIGIGTFVTALPFFAGWVRPYLAFLLLSAAVLIWLELLAQSPPDILIYRGPPPTGAPWRLVGFAYALQLTMVGVIGSFLWRMPRLIIPTLAAIIGFGLWQFLLPQRIKEQRGAFLVTAIVALGISIAVLSLVHPTYQSIFAEDQPNEP
jgi:hypothetical protein